MIIKDRILLSTFAGFIAALGANLSLYIMNLFIPDPTINMPQVTLEIFLNIGDYSIFQRVLGLLWSTIIGGSYALLYLVTLDLTGWNNLFIKSVIVVNGGWLLGAGFIIRLFNIAPQVRDTPVAIGAFYLAHLLFAIYLYLLVNSFGAEKEKSSTNNNCNPVIFMLEAEEHKTSIFRRIQNLLSGKHNKS